jgi:N-methylhydantoinase A/oxoprolinase/acetone carboxylase beta subunit
MGILALKDGDDDAIALDIGGTTTDIAVFADGVPLLEPLGATIAGHKTLIRGLLTRSIGIGGDSRVIVKDGNLIIGPEREGPAAALGGPSPTPTDAMIILGLTDIGDRQKALEAVKTIADKIGLDVENAARMIFESACRTIASAADEILTEINNKPVYTIHEMLEGKQIKPRVVYIVGGPSKPMAPRIEEIMGIKACVPEHSEVANAMGAALARTTTEVTLLADTERKKLVIPEEGMETTVSQYFTHQEAVDMCIYTLRSRAIKMGASEEDLDIEIIEDQSFNMVRGMGSVTGKNMRIKAQVKPGLIAGYEKGVL